MIILSTFNRCVHNLLKKYYYSLFIRRKNEIQAFRYAKLFLKPGVYYANKNGRFNRIDRYVLFPSNISHLFFIRTSGANEYPKAEYIDFSIGQGKVIILIQSKSYGFFFTQKGYENAYRTYKEYYSNFNYPCVKIFSFSARKNLIIMERLLGKHFFDGTHDLVIVRDLLLLACSSPIQKDNNGVVKFLQHGDTNRKNVIWNNNNYSYIDLDNVGYYPPLLDVFHYLCMSGYSLSEIVSVLNENIKTVETICNRANIVSDNLLDELFYGYVDHYIRMNACFEDFRFLTVENTLDYPKTHRLLCSKETSDSFDSI